MGQDNLGLQDKPVIAVDPVIMANTKWHHRCGEDGRGGKAC